MHRQAGRYLKTEYYIEIECLPDDQLFSPTEIVKRKYNKKVDHESYTRMFHSIYQFGVRNGLALFPDNAKRLPGGKLAMKAEGRAKLKKGEQRARWYGKTWKSKLYIEDRDSIKSYTQNLLIDTLHLCLDKKRRELEAAEKVRRRIAMKKGLWVAALVAAIVFTAAGIYNYSYLSEGYGVLRSQGPQAAVEYFQNRGESYDNLFGQAWSTFRNGDYDQAEKLCHRVLKSREDNDRAQGYYLLGNLDIKQGKFDLAQEHLQAAEAIYESLGNTKSLYRTRLVQAKMYLDLKDLDNARFYANLAGQTSQAQSDEYFYYIQSQIAFSFSDLEAALDFALQREKVFAGDQSQLISMYSDIGFYSGLLGDSDKCLSYTIKAEALANEQKNTKGMMFNNVNMCLYLKCSQRDYSDLRGSILDYARENKEVKLMEWMYFVDKFTCPLETVGDGDPPPPADPPPGSFMVPQFSGNSNGNPVVPQKRAEPGHLPPPSGAANSPENSPSNPPEGNQGN